MAEHGPGSFVNLEHGDPQLKKLAAQDYAQAGLIATEEKFFAVTKDDGRWCPSCRRLWNRWNAVCVKCGRDTVPESEMPRDLPSGQYAPFGPVRGLTA
jgi:hypothetical protein